MSSVECHHNIIMQIFVMCKYTNTPFTLTYPDRAAGMLRLTVTPLVSQQPVWFHDMSIRPVDTIAVAEFQNRKCEAMQSTDHRTFVFIGNFGTSWNFFLGWSLVFLERPGTS